MSKHKFILEGEDTAYFRIFSLLFMITVRLAVTRAQENTLKIGFFVAPIFWGFTYYKCMIYIFCNIVNEQFSQH